MNPLNLLKASFFSGPPVRAASISFANALFQVIALKLLVRGPLLHARLVISLVAGLAVFWLGLGAALALVTRRGSRRAVEFAAGLSVLLGGAGIPLLLERASDGPAGIGAAVWLSFVSLSLPLCLMGAALGMVYRETDTGQKGAAARLVASGTLGFILGLAIAQPLIALSGIAPALALSALLAALPSRPLLGAAGAAAASALIWSVGLERELDALTLPEAAFWQQDRAAGHRHLLGGWSPYSRVDFYRTPSGYLAGVYNGSQQWAVRPPEQDFDVRRALFASLTGDILLIGAGGGQGVMDLKAARSVVAVELDPLVVAAMQGPLAAYNARAYSKHPVVAGDGRSYLDRTDRRFDAIVFEGADAAVSRLPNSVISFESTLFTREGLARAASRLSAAGLLVAMHSRLTAPTARFVRGLPAGFHTRIWKGVTLSPTMNFPFVMALSSRSNAVLDRFSALLDRFHYARKSPDDYREWKPITDDRPFLYFKSPNELVPLFVFGGVVFLALCLFFLLLRPRALTGYFSLIGIGYMVVELFLLAAYRSALGGYSDTYVAVLGTLCVSSAVGSLLWERLGKKAATAITGCGVVLTLLCTHLSGSIGDNFWLRLLLVFFGCAPIGFALGLFLPAGLSRAAGKAAAFLAVDAVASALGFALFYLSALNFGFFFSFAVACFCYAGGLFLWPVDT